MSTDWKDYPKANQNKMLEVIDTTYPRLKLEKIVQVISSLPIDKKFINKIKKLVNIIDNKNTYFTKKKNMKNFSYQNTWNNINQKIISVINEN